MYFPRMSMVADFVEPPPSGVKKRPVVEMDDERFHGFCAANRDLRIERDRHGNLITMAPAASSSGYGNTELVWHFKSWAKKRGLRGVFGESAGFKLPNGAIRAPDVAWVRPERLKGLTKKQWDEFAPLCPDFVLELRSPSDSLRVLREKMEEYMEQGAQLGWLLDPKTRRVSIYRPGEPVETLDDPVTISGEPVLPGFTLNVRELWEEMESPG